ncbi:MAG: xylan 1,4-beta-xylosidase [Ruminococcus sp.]|nr:xylan 1,4-beta-xylosidase [Ruminococcus sp.]
MKKNDRFAEVFSKGKVDHIEVFVDKRTGVNCVFRSARYSGGLTALLDKDGKPVVTPVSDFDK